ncbi:MAG: hypothetical protein IJE62_05920 [Clostridia bacterium]|nr:hypothetical protein [Clostridia bacterium]
MKKFLSVVLCISLLICSSILVYADEFSYNYGISPKLIEREQNLLSEIESNLDEIHAQIAEYQQNTIQPRGVQYGGFQYLDGDILVTKSTILWGLTGHAGILVGDKVLEITPTYNNGVPAAIPMATWFSRYPETMVVRYNGERDIPVDAAWYGHTFYVNGAGADNEYSLVSSLTSLDKDYCSSLVWKCYHYGANFDYEVLDGGTLEWTIPVTILPYDFIMDGYYQHNNFSIVHSVNW